MKSLITISLLFLSVLTTLEGKSHLDEYTGNDCGENSLI